MSLHVHGPSDQAHLLPNTGQGRLAELCVNWLALTGDVCCRIWALNAKPGSSNRHRASLFRGRVSKRQWTVVTDRCLWCTPGRPRILITLDGCQTGGVSVFFVGARGASWRGPIRTVHKNSDATYALTQLRSYVAVGQVRCCRWCCWPTARALKKKKRVGVSTVRKVNGNAVVRPCLCA